MIFPRDGAAVRRQGSVWILLGLVVACLATPPAVHAVGGGVVDQSTRLHLQLTEQILPYWYDTTWDRENGGYILADNGQFLGGATEKQVVSQARLIWTFSHAHRKGFSTDDRNYLQAAEQGYRFLMQHFHDPIHGGFFWRTDLAGKPLLENKILYGQAFVLYALVEYTRASGDEEPRRQAMHLFATLDGLARDKKNGGWIEHFRKDWKPILTPGPGTEVEVAGYKSANTHLHMMEALTELFRETADFDVRRALVDTVNINKQYFYPRDPAASAFHRKQDWGVVRDPASAGLSYGHNVEFAWLLIEAERALGWKPSWDHFHDYLDHTIRFGVDGRHGGVYNRGVGREPASQLDKIWWVQAEMMAALTEALKHQRVGLYESILVQLIDFVQDHMASPKDAVWIDTANPDGKPKNPAKAHVWKANYHDVRAIIRFTEAFKPRSTPNTR